MAELLDLPEGRPGCPSRAMTQEQAGTVLATAAAMATGYTQLIQIGRYKAAGASAHISGAELAARPTALGRPLPRSRASLSRCSSVSGGRLRAMRTAA